MAFPKDTTRISLGTLDSEGLSDEWTNVEKQLGVRPVVGLGGSLAENRKAMDDGSFARDKTSLTPALSNDVTAQDIVTDTGINVRVYHPVNVRSRRLPGALYLHGGGWLLGSVAGDDLLCRQLALDSHHVVVSVNYRLAPEHPFPAATDDSFAVLQWMSAQAEHLGVDPAKIYATGASAGGHLAAALAVKVASSSTPNLLAALVPRVPLTVHPKAFPGTLPSRTNTPIITDAIAAAMIDAYVPHPKKDATNPLVSPLLASDDVLKKLPPTYLDVCVPDPFYDSGIAFANKLEEVGVPVKLTVIEGMPHAFFTVAPGLPSAVAAQKAVVAGTEWALALAAKKA